MAEDYDVIVIGGGPAGYSAALRSGALHARTALIEADALGGTCLNRGCIPTKYYLKSAEVIHNLAQADRRGIRIVDSSFSMDMPKAVKDKDRIVRQLTGGIKGLLKQRGVDVFSGKATALGDGRVAIDGEAALQGTSVILAGGSRPGSIPIPGIDLPGVLTSDEILDISEVPESLVILGGGVIGIEMSMIFHAFGSSVTVIELEDRILPFMDRDISKSMGDLLGKRGIRILTRTKAEEITRSGDHFEIRLEGRESLNAVKVLVAAGRQPDLSCIDTGLVETHRGRIITDEYMRTSSSGIYAPGDINGRSMLAHAAFHMGTRAAEHAVLPADEAQPVDLRYVPSIVYGLPEAASVGLTMDEARNQYDAAAGVFPLSANGRALASGEPDGYVQVVSEKRYGRILGVHIVGHGASEIINEAAVLMAMEITVHELSQCIHGHPTVSEALMEAAAVILGRSVHL